jgi:hypothetical protein
MVLQVHVRQDVQPSPRTGGALLVGLMLGSAAASSALAWDVLGLRISNVLLITAFVIAILTSQRGRVLGYRIGALELSLGFLLCARICLELINSVDLDHEPRFDTTLQFFLYLLGAAAAKLHVRDRRSLNVLLAGLAAPAPAMALLGLLQAGRVAEITEWILANTDSPSAAGRHLRGEFPRATGLTGHWTGFGSYLVGAGATLLVRRSFMGRGGAWSTLAIAIIGLGVVSTLTISVVVSYGALVLIYVLASRSLIRWIPLLAVAPVGAAAIFGDLLSRRLSDQFEAGGGGFAQSQGIIPETIAYRLGIWERETIPAIFERPLTGWGQGFYIEFGEWVTFPRYVAWGSAESQWFLTLVTGGVVELIALVVLLYVLLRVYLAQSGPARWVLVGLWVMVMVTCVTVPQFTNAGLPAILLALTGALVGNLEKSNSDGGLPPDSPVPNKQDLLVG